MTNARTMGNVRTDKVRTSYNYRKKLNTGSGRTVRTVKMRDGRTVSSGRTAGTVSSGRTAGTASSGRTIRTASSGRTAGAVSRNAIRSTGRRIQSADYAKSSTYSGRKSRSHAGAAVSMRQSASVYAENPYDDLREKVYASGGRKRRKSSGRAKPGQNIRKMNGTERTRTAGTVRKSRAGTASLSMGRAMPSSAAGRTAVSVRTKKNRTKALEVDRTYVMFLAVMCLLTVFVCVRYLQLKEIITTQTRNNTKLTAELDSLRNENDALLENVTNDIDWEHIRDVAINELGMKYATEDQIVWYTTEDREYVHQFEDVPSG